MGGQSAFFFLSLPFPIPSPSLLPLRSRPLKSICVVWGALYAPPAGSGEEPQPKSNLVHLSFKIWHGGNSFNHLSKNRLNRFGRNAWTGWAICPEYVGFSWHVKSWSEMRHLTGRFSSQTQEMSSCLLAIRPFTPCLKKCADLFFAPSRSNKIYPGINT